MNPIPIFGLGLQSKSAVVTSQSRVNFYLENTVDGDKVQTIAVGIPGLTLFADHGDTPIRGLHTVGDYIYTVHRDKFWQVNNGGIAVEKGTIGTTAGRVSIADNGAQIMLTDGVKSYIYTVATEVFAEITSPNIPVGTCVVFIDGFFAINRTGTGQFAISALYDGLTWDALDFATAEANPDNVVSMAVDRGVLILYGVDTSEEWANTGAVDFPFSRIQGAVTEYGNAAAWSVAKFQNSLAWLAKNRLGETQIMQSVGGLPQRISTTDIESIISGYSSTADATAFSYLHRGHSFYQINFTRGGASWLYDGSTGAWSQMRSDGIGRHRAEMAVNYLNKTIIADHVTGKLYRVDPDNYTENGATIVGELTSKHVFAGLERYAISALQVDCETGVGLSTGQGVAPQIMLQISKDGGRTWSSEKWRSMGAIGKYLTRVRWNRLGQARDWVFRLKISDPVKRVITGAWITGS